MKPSMLTCDLVTTPSAHHRKQMRQIRDALSYMLYWRVANSELCSGRGRVQLKSVHWLFMSGKEDGVFSYMQSLELVTMRMDYVRPNLKDWQYLEVINEICKAILEAERGRTKMRYAFSGISIRASKTESTYMIRAIKALRVGAEWWEIIRSKGETQ